MDTPRKQKPASGLRVKILAGILVTFVALWASSRIQVRALEIELAEVAKQKIPELISPDQQNGLEVAVPVVTVSKQYLLFGKTTGKVTIYMRPVAANKADELDHGGEAIHSDADDHEEEKDVQPIAGGRGSNVGRGAGSGTKLDGHKHQGGITGIEFFLEKENGEWLDRESGSCSSEQCQVEGKAAFEKGSILTASALSEI